MFFESLFHRRKYRLKTWECYNYPQRPKDDPIRIAREEAIKRKEEIRPLFEEQLKSSMR